MKKIIVLIVFSTLWLYGLAQKTSVSGTFSHLTDKDTVHLIIYKYGTFPDQISELNSDYSAKVSNHKFHFTIPITDNRPYEYSLILPRQRSGINLHLILEKGDEIEISGNDYIIQKFKGKGSAKLNIIRKLNSLDRAVEKQTFSSTSTDLQNVIKAANNHVTTVERYLKSQKKQLNPLIYQMLLFKIDYQLTGVYYSLWYMAQNNSIKYALTDNWYPFRKLHPFQKANKTAQYSSEFTLSVINDYAIKEIVKDDDFQTLSYSRGLKKLYDYFKSHYTGILREKLITYIILSASNSNDLRYCYEDAMGYIKNNDFKLALNNHCQCLPGSPAYNFTLKDTLGITHQLSEYKGKIIVLDFWFTGCGNCRELTPHLKHVEEKFKNNENVVFISISSDKNIDLWKSGIKSGFYITSPNEINLYTGGKGENDPVYSRTNTTGSPTLRLIDQNGSWLDNPVDCRVDNGIDLIAKINKALKN